ncbi:stage II sporulation protein M [uncultured Dysosmobacter sp.]|uniref:stage II sporulation protein M n=1 Tax=uncultured Dysosmobacter sp. TaxID=2591384 RepID=UPI0026208AF5|nr:stage II sporulation protein M [uncultured Dysosmobacter sp.]
MRDFLQYQFDGLKNAWHNGLNGEVKRTAIAFPLLAVLAFALCMFLPDLRTQLVKLVLDAMDGLHVVEEDGSLSALGLFSNNLRACAFTMVYGLIPFLYLSAMALGINAMLLGILAAWYLSEGVSMLGYLAAIVPHGIFELPALVLAFAMGLYVCGQLTRRCRRDSSALHVWDCLVLISRMLLLVLIPLLAVSAVVEAYVTPAVLSLLF